MAGTFNEIVENMETCTITPETIMVTSLEGTHVLDRPHNGPTDATQPATTQNQKEVEKNYPRLTPHKLRGNGHNPARLQT